MRRKLRSADTLTEPIIRAELIEKPELQTDLQYFLRGTMTETGRAPEAFRIPAKYGGGSFAYIPTVEQADFVFYFKRPEEDEALEVFLTKTRRAKRFKKAYEARFGSVAAEDFNGWDIEKVLQLILSFYKTEGGKP